MEWIIGIIVFVLLLVGAIFRKAIIDIFSPIVKEWLEWLLNKFKILNKFKKNKDDKNEEKNDDILLKNKIIRFFTGYIDDRLFFDIDYRKRIISFGYYIATDYSIGNYSPMINLKIPIKDFFLYYDCEEIYRLYQNQEFAQSGRISTTSDLWEQIRILYYYYYIQHSEKFIDVLELNGDKTFIGQCDINIELDFEITSTNFYDIKDEIKLFEKENKI